MSDVAAVEATGLVKRYREVTAVGGVSLRVRPGEIYALLGLNGAGKTTTIRMLLGMVKPTAGSVSVFGETIRPGSPAVWSNVGYLVERSAAYPELTVRENLELVRRLRRLPSRGAVADWIERLGLAGYADRRARGLSRGNAQRLALAKALIGHPDLLVLDEPANALDPAGMVEIRQLLRELAEAHGVAVLLSSHVLAEVVKLATRIGILHEGRMVRELTADELAAGLRPRLRVAARDLVAAAAALRDAGLHPRPDRDQIVAAKLTVISLWCLLLSLLVFTLGLVIGAALRLPGWSTGTAFHALGRQLATAAMTVLLAWAFGLVASIARGYLAAVGTMFLAVFLAQILAALGYGQYFPWAVASLYSGVAGQHRTSVGALGVGLVILVGAASALGTALWWRTADHAR